MLERDKYVISALIGLAAGLSIMAAAPHLPWAGQYSQYVYDCGIRVAADVEGGTLSSFIIIGHHYAVCYD